jgi:hypothetical protein
MLELVEEATAGCHFREPDELAGCIEVVTENWEHLSERASAYARLHTWTDVFQAYSELFKSLI